VKTAFRRIVLATDASRQAEAARHVAAAVAAASGAAVRVVHCWSLELHHRHGTWDAEARAEARRLIDEEVDRLRALGIRADAQLVHADTKHVAAAIAQAVRGFDADLLVVGSRGLSEWRSLFKRSVSHELLRAVDCPTLIVREDAASVLHEPVRVMVAVAGGDDVSPAVDAAIAIANRTPGSRVLVTHVAQALVNSAGWAYVEPSEEIEETLESAVSTLRRAGIAAERKVARPGAVAHALAQVAWEWQADLIVIGSSRTSDLAGIVFGSVTHDLLRETPRPVLVAERVAL